jgi:hypothetical protein
MPEKALDELQALDAIASERGGVLAFRVCEESGELEPVFMHVLRASGEREQEVALIALTDASGLSLGRYVLSRSRLDDVLERAERIGDEDSGPAVVPADWATG